MQNKVALLSFVRNLNYGGSLQLYALERFLEKEYPNVKFEYINYTKNQLLAMIKWFGRKVVFALLGKDDSPSWTVKQYVDILLKSFQADSNESMEENNQLFESFWNLSNYSEQVNKKKIKRLNDEYSLFIVGSDQTWNCGRVDLDTAYLLDFVNDNKKKGSYAPSLALKQIPAKYEKKYRKYLSQFTYLSCREQKGAEIISSLVNRGVKNVVDPVFLLDQTDWSQIADKSVIKTSEEYVLVYMLECSEALLKMAKDYANQNHVAIKIIYGDIEKNTSLGPCEWIYLFKNGKYVFTNSFHGTAFSIIFNLPFRVEITNQDFFQQSSDRITDLLKKTGLEERCVSNNFEYEEKDIDYDRVNNIINNERYSSILYINEMMSEIK